MPCILTVVLVIPVVAEHCSVPLTLHCPSGAPPASRRDGLCSSNAKVFTQVVRSFSILAF